MTNFFVAITAYERPKRTQRLLTQLSQQLGVRTDIHVFYDGPTPPKAVELAATARGTLHTTRSRLGKEGYWRLFNYAIFEAEMSADEAPWDYFLFLQDDVSIEDPNLLRTAADIVTGLDEQVHRLATFNLYGDGPDWDRSARWTGRPTVQMLDGWIYASWVDMVAVLFTPLALREVPRLSPPNNDREGDSSGVGRQLSRRYDERCMAQLMVPEPVVEHEDGGVSKMHPGKIR